jgi:PBP1b-binding outer membrane lipoprotein LpoB
MKKLIILALILSSCSQVWHVKKAVKKGYNPQKEVVEVERFELIHIIDSITNEIIRVDTIRTKETRTIYQDRPLLRYETRLIRDTVRIVTRAETAQKQSEDKKAIKTTKIENKRSKWWLWLLIGLGAGVFRKNIWRLVRKLIIKV